MQEGTAATINLKDMEGSVLEAFVSHMYGTLQNITPGQLMPLFLAADAHQVTPCNAVCLHWLLIAAIHAGQRARGKLMFLADKLSCSTCCHASTGHHLKQLHAITHVSKTGQI